MGLLSFSVIIILVLVSIKIALAMVKVKAEIYLYSGEKTEKIMNNVISLIENVISGKLTVKEFSDQFYQAYDLGEDDFSDDEESILNELSKVSARYSPYESDHRAYPGVYYTEAEVINCAKEVLQSLKGGNPT